MKVENFKIFLTVARTENMHKTAEIFFTSYQNISFIIKNMEKELGFTLFNRDQKGVHLTQEGAELLAIVEPFIIEYDQLLSRQGSKTSMPVFQLYTTPVLEPYVRLIPNLIYSDFYYCSLKKCSVGEMFDMLNANQQGIYLMPHFKSVSQPRMHRQECIVLAQDKIMTICHASNATTQKNNIQTDMHRTQPILTNGNYPIKITKQTVLNIDDIELCKKYMREKGLYYNTVGFIYRNEFIESDEWVVQKEREKYEIEYELIFNLPKQQKEIGRHYFLEPLQKMFQK